jgi:hypothetical protein
MAQGLFEPLVLGGPGGDFWVNVWRGWMCSQSGLVDRAKHYYALADEALPQGRLNPSLSVLRHNVGVGEGSVESVAATEDQVVSLFLGRRTEKSDYSKYAIGDISEYNIERIIADVDPGHHRDNIPVPRPHVMVMSTGRCGTMSLHKLFQDSNLSSYHSYWFMPSIFSRREMTCRLHAGNYEDLTVMAEWANTRAAEWLGGNPMIGLNHTDTVYAPIFAAIHKNSRFVYLRRDPERVFNSFYTKGQYRQGETCLYPVTYDFENGYQFSFREIDEKDGIQYHIRQTEQFSRAFGRVMGDRWIEISADRLFGQDTEEIAKLLEFTNSDIPLENAVEHFKTPINVKAHKCRFS